MWHRRSQDVKEIASGTLPETLPALRQAVMARPRLLAELEARPSKPRAARPRGTYVARALVVLAYLATTGWLLVSTDFLPYVMDNNESFSSLVHATNLDRFGFSSAFGLTDEA
jgi:hypothetical protein